MTHGPTADIGFAHGLHRDSRQDPRCHSHLFQGILQRERVDDSCQHAHLVGGRAVHAAGFVFATTQNVARADHQSKLHPDVRDFFEFLGDLS